MPSCFLSHTVTGAWQPSLGETDRKPIPSLRSVTYAIAPSERRVAPHREVRGEGAWYPRAPPLKLLSVAINVITTNLKNRTFSERIAWVR